MLEQLLLSFQKQGKEKEKHIKDGQVLDKAARHCCGICWTNLTVGMIVYFKTWRPLKVTAFVSCRTSYTNLWKWLFYPKRANAILHAYFWKKKASVIKLPKFDFI